MRTHRSLKLSRRSSAVVERLSHALTAYYGSTVGKGEMTRVRIAPVTKWFCAKGAGEVAGFHTFCLIRDSRTFSPACVSFKHFYLVHNGAHRSKF